jgi:LysM repeat protein
MNAKFAKQEQTLRELQYTLQAIQSRLDAIEGRQESLSSRMKALENGGQFASKDDLVALRVDLNALSASQSNMREAVVNEISGKMTKLINQRDAAAQKKAEEAKAKSGYEHIVEAGQTISAIASAYKVPVKTILKANNIKDPTKIRVGQKLFIPDP